MSLLWGKAILTPKPTSRGGGKSQKAWRGGLLTKRRPVVSYQGGYFLVMRWASFGGLEFVGGRALAPAHRWSVLKKTERAEN